MRLVPPKSRQILDWSKFEEKENDSYLLSLLPFYAELFSFLHPNIISKSNTGWRNSKSGKAKYAFFNTLSSGNIKIIEKFIADFKQLVVIGINKNIKPFFTNELDSCIALDYNKVYETMEHTFLGEIEFEAKYNESIINKDRLIKHLSEHISNIPVGILNSPPILMYVPSSKNESWPLPKILAEGICANPNVKKLLSKNKPFIHSTIRGEKEKLREKHWNEKVPVWNKLIDSDRIELVDSVVGENIIVIDDLYQSGTTLWSFAKFLKSKGVNSVHGLVCVKSMRDTDNK